MLGNRAASVSCMSALFSSLLTWCAHLRSLVVYRRWRGRRYRNIFCWCERNLWQKHLCEVAKAIYSLRNCYLQSPFSSLHPTRRLPQLRHRFIENEFRVRMDDDNQPPQWIGPSDMIHKRNFIKIWWRLCGGGEETTEREDGRQRQQTRRELIKKPFELIVIARPPSPNRIPFAESDPRRADFLLRFTVCDSWLGGLATQNPIIHLLIVIFLFPDFRKMKITFLWQLEDFLVKFRDYSRHRIISDCIRLPAPWHPCVAMSWVGSTAPRFLSVFPDCCCCRLGQLRFVVSDKVSTCNSAIREKQSN